MRRFPSSCKSYWTRAPTPGQETCSRCEGRAAHAVSCSGVLGVLRRAGTCRRRAGDVLKARARIRTVLQRSVPQLRRPSIRQGWGPHRAQTHLALPGARSRPGQFGCSAPRTARARDHTPARPLADAHQPPLLLPPRPASPTRRCSSCWQSAASTSRRKRRLRGSHYTSRVRLGWGGAGGAARRGTLGSNSGCGRSMSVGWCVEQRLGVHGDCGRMRAAACLPVVAWLGLALLRPVYKHQACPPPTITTTLPSPALQWRCWGWGCWR